MLAELRIRNYALIDQLSVRLAPGLNVLSGETGAGKSIIVGALGLLLGERASAEAVRRGAERASVEGVFEIDGRPDVLQLLDERGVEAEEGVLILKRDVAAEGRSRAWINGSPATAGLLGEIGRTLVDLHGQHEHQTLLRRDEQRAILDAYADAEPRRDQVKTAHAALARVRGERGELEERRRRAEERADLLRYQAEEIESAAPVPGEEESLGEEARRLAHAEELGGLAGGVHEALSGADRSVLGQLAALRRPTEQLVRIDPSQGEVSELYDTAFFALQELGERMERYAAAVEHDPARLDELRRRQDLLFRLRSKYGPSLEEVIEIGRAAREELELLDAAGFEMAALQRREAEAAAGLAAAAAALSHARGEALERLAAEVSAVLPELGMEDGRFEAVALPLPSIGPHGAEEIEFRVALNRGFEPRPIAQVASGGELSRVMLALKTILARLDAVPTLIFDEVDAGIGGRVGLQVGDKMRQVAASHQVLAITHLPQIASRAHLHLRVEKGEVSGVGTTRVRALDEAERVREIARMLGGDPESSVSLEHARELLARGAEV
ncbi:MAG: DNA repair protein RecN [Gemmatimonadota bacterium]|jgi:DNA repair protein RecN (Recombination protein N)|nr:DNA repair protein RecN [Gemmatimonadota bacterium]